VPYDRNNLSNIHTGEKQYAVTVNVIVTNWPGNFNEDIEVRNVGHDFDELVKRQKAVPTWFEAVSSSSTVTVCTANEFMCSCPATNSDCEVDLVIRR
jgi:hypothetical protein